MCGLKAIIDITSLTKKTLQPVILYLKLTADKCFWSHAKWKEAVDLLVENNYQLAREKAEQINQYNEARKDLDKGVTEEANRIVDEYKELDSKRHCVIQ